MNLIFNTSKTLKQPVGAIFFSDLLSVLKDSTALFVIYDNTVSCEMQGGVLSKNQ